MVDFDEERGSLLYEERYQLRQPDWTYDSQSAITASTFMPSSSPML